MIENNKKQMNKNNLFLVNNDKLNRI